MIPQMSFAIVLPEMLVNSPRLHNQFVKAGVRDELQTHWLKRIPLHFVQSAHAKYGYAKRSPRYISFKIRRYGTGTDLVKTGRTRTTMKTVAKITVGGSATGGKGDGVKGQLRLRFPFFGGGGGVLSQSKQRANLENMRREIEATTAAERVEITNSLGARYIQRVETDTSARQRRTITI